MLLICRWRHIQTLTFIFSAPVARRPLFGDNRLRGLVHRYNYAVWMAVMLNSLGGLVVAMAVKYADNVIKGFATSISIVLTALVSCTPSGCS